MDPCVPAKLDPRPAAGLRRWAGPLTQRPMRVLALVAIIIALSLADLAMTLTHVGGAGMLEANPIARQIMRSGSSGAVVAWKMATAGLGCAILLAIRRHPGAEIGAALCAAVLVWLTTQWSRYNELAHTMTAQIHSTSLDPDPRWVSLQPHPPRGNHIVPSEPRP